ncbi:MAG TPA: hypothetical protein VE597_03025, partial [Geminicoccaceae bacterium]|nr:hypothetical protein [Geminicoccaceae bacterium]
GISQVARKTPPPSTSTRSSTKIRRLIVDIVSSAVRVGPGEGLASRPDRSFISDCVAKFQRQVNQPHG